MGNADHGWSDNFGSGNDVMINSLSLTASFVSDLKILTAPEFNPEDIRLGDYALLPYVRTGLAAGITTDPEAGAVRATVTAGFDVAASDGTGAVMPVNRQLTLYGPGDVTGIDPSQIIRREPTKDTLLAEETFLAHIEFDRPDFPWLFSPLAAVGNRLKPWLALVLVEKAGAVLEPSADERPMRLTTTLGQLQDLADNHLFAHAQCVGAKVTAAGIVMDLPASDPSSLAARLSDEHGPANLSRLICPRNPAPGVSYIAALVPAFDCGVKAGLGMGAGTLADAWVRAANNSDAALQIILPVYDCWEFTTGPAGDFKSLSEKLQGIAAPWPIGRRMIDMSVPGSGIPDLAAGSPGAVQILECALYSPAATPADAPLDANWPAPQRAALRDRVNEGNDTNPDLPRVGPRMYARHQAGQHRIGQQGAPFNAAEMDARWFSQLNTNPAHRVVAGLGSRVVQRDQEPLMQAAWAQIDGVRKANQAVNWAQFAEAINVSVHDRHIAPLDLGRLTQVTRNIHSRIKVAARATTLATTIATSQTAEAVTTIVYRRALRASAPMVQREAVAAPGLNRAVALDDHRTGYRTPDGISGLSEQGMQFFTDAQIGAVVGVAPAQARAELNRRTRALGQSGTMFDFLTTSDAAWKVKPGLRAGDAVAGVLLGAATVGIDPAALAGTSVDIGPRAAILAGIAGTSGAAATTAKTTLGSLALAAPKQTLRQEAVIGIGAGIGAALGDGQMIRPVDRTFGAGRGGLQPNTPMAPLRRRSAPLIVDPQVRRDVRGGPDLVQITPQMRFEQPISATITAAIAALNAQSPARVVEGLRAIVTGGVTAPMIATELPKLTLTKPQLLAELNPQTRSRDAFKGRVQSLPDAVPQGWFDREILRPVMAAPVFKRPMYQALEAYDRNWLVPGLGSIPNRDFVTLLKVNATFCESFLVGASDEFGRELLWRDYPTDQRGTYFHRFWDADQDELTRKIHRFNPNLPLGRNFSLGGTATGGPERLVLVIRGDLVRRYPDLVAAAVQETGPAGGDVTFGEDSDAPILFKAHLAPDYKLIGFDLTEAQVASGRWWFLLAENPTAPRFGLGVENNASAASLNHDNVDWDDFYAGTARPLGGQFLMPQARAGTVTVTDTSPAGSKPASVQWPGHAGIVARTLLRNPVRAAFDAKTLIASIQTVS